jgi:hypothetical protein
MGNNSSNSNTDNQSGGFKWESFKDMKKNYQNNPGNSYGGSSGGSGSNWGGQGNTGNNNTTQFGNFGGQSNPYSSNEGNGGSYGGQGNPWGSDSGKPKVNMGIPSSNFDPNQRGGSSNFDPNQRGGSSNFDPNQRGGSSNFDPNKRSDKPEPSMFDKVVHKFSGVFEKKDPFSDIEGKGGSIKSHPRPDGQRDFEYPIKSQNF